MFNIHWCRFGYKILNWQMQISPEESTLEYNENNDVEKVSNNIVDDNSNINEIKE